MLVTRSKLRSVDYRGGGMNISLDVVSFILGVIATAVGYTIYRYGVEQGSKRKGKKGD